MKAWQELVAAFRTTSLAEIRKLIMAAVAVVGNVVWFAVVAGLLPEDVAAVQWFLSVAIPLASLYGVWKVPNAAPPVKVT